MSGLNRYLTMGLAVLAAVTVSVSAHAVPQLRISDGINTVIVTDEGAGDIGAGAGVVVFNGSVGNFVINVTTGITNPVLGSSTEPVLDLNSIDVNDGSGTLTIEFSQTDFIAAGPSVGFATEIGGVTADTVQFEHFASASNLNFAQDIALFDSGAMTGGVLYVDSTTANLSGSYSLTTLVTITHNGSGQNTSFNSVLQTEIPEPALAPSLAIGLLLLAGRTLSRRRNR